MRGDFHRTSDEQVRQKVAPEWCKVAFRTIKTGPEVSQLHLIHTVA